MGNAEYMQKISGKIGIFSIKYVLIFVYLFVHANRDLESNEELVHIVSAVLIVFGIIYYFAKTGRKTASSYYIWLGLFFLWCFASTIWSVSLNRSMEYFLSIGLIYMCIISIFIMINTYDEYILLLAVVAAVGIALMLYIFLNFNFLEILSSDRRLGYYSLNENWNSNEMALTFMNSILTLSVLIKYTKRPYIRILTFIVIGLLTFMVFLTGSRRAIIGIVIYVSASYLIMTRHKIKTKLIHLAVILLSVPLIYRIMITNEGMYNKVGIRIESMLQGLFNHVTEEKSFNEHMDMLTAGIRYFNNNPLFGNGLDSYRVLYRRDYGINLYSHNNYIELLSGIGIIGFCIYYGGYVFALYKIWICIINSRNCVNTFLFSFLIADLFVQLFYVGYSNLNGIFLIMLAFLYMKKNICGYENG